MSKYLPSAAQIVRVSIVIIIFNILARMFPQLRVWEKFGSA